jgi:hypothetical protein
MKGLETCHNCAMYLRSLYQFSSVNFLSCCSWTEIPILGARTRRTCTENGGKATFVLIIGLLQAFSTILLFAGHWTQCCVDMAVEGTLHCTLSSVTDTEHTIHPGGQQRCRSRNKCWNVCWNVLKLYWASTDRSVNINTARKCFENVINYVAIITNPQNNICG